MGNFKIKNDNRRPLISVITVGLNAKKYIEQCIQSVIKQDYHDFEYVVIDGGSTDGTIEIIERYNDRISYWHTKKDRGLAHAFNEGVKNSNGNWLLFLNSDDVFVNNEILSNMSSVLINNKNADVVFGQVNIVSREQEPSKIGGPYGGPFKWSQFLTQDTIPHQSAFTNMLFFKQVGMFDEDFKIAVDYEHYLRAGPDIQTIFYPLIIANMRDGGLSQKNIFETLVDCHKARVKNNSATYIIVLTILVYLMLRAYIGRCVRKYILYINK